MKGNLLTELKINDISLSDNNPRKTYDEESLKDLASSIYSKGVLQPVVVRYKRDVDGYELICGHRRIKAAIMAGLEEVPANVMDNVSDEEAFEMQITENLERKDVHPLEEGEAFQKLIDNGHTIGDISEKFVRSWTFIAHRLKLLDLIEPIKKDFYEGHLSISQAVLLARSTKGAQEDIYRDINEEGGWLDGYGTYKELKRELEQKYMELNEAPFPLNDEHLYHKAGACTECPKRSTCNPKLFPDYQEEDKCFDKKCFDQKVHNHIEREVSKILKENSEVILLQERYSNEPEDTIFHLAEEYDKKIYKLYDDFRRIYGDDDKNTIKGFWTNGYSRGKYEDVLLTSIWTSSTNGPDEERDPMQTQDIEIQKIKERNERAIDLDDVKVIKAINQLDVVKNYHEREDSLTALEHRAFLFVWKKRVLTWDAEEVFNEIYEINKYGDPLDEFHFFRNLSDEDLVVCQMTLIRLGLKGELSGETEAIMRKRSDTTFWYQIFLEYVPEVVYEIYNSQREKAIKRNERVKERIEKLEAQKEKQE